MIKETIGDLQDLSGVLGACLFHGQKGVLESNLPSIFTAVKLANLGKLLMKLHSAGRMNFHDLTDLSLHYDESMILVREIDKDLIIFLLCDPDCNQNLLSMSLNLAQQDLKNQLYAVSPAPREKTPSAPSENVAAVLAAMKLHLPKIMGPMADIIFDETVETWQEQGNCTLSGIDSLVQLLAEEIGSAEKINRFKEMIAPALSRAGKG
ncbi:MAG: hypothetical protein ACWGOX_00620 [Desulforhopalus sp.]